MMPAERSFGSPLKCATAWLNFSNMNSKRVPRNLGDARKAGRRDTAFHCYYSSGICWTTASISSFGVNGFVDVSIVFFLLFFLLVVQQNIFFFFFFVYFFLPAFFFFFFF